LAQDGFNKGLRNPLEEGLLKGCLWEGKAGLILTFQGKNPLGKEFGEKGGKL